MLYNVYCCMHTAGVVGFVGVGPGECGGYPGQVPGDEEGAAERGERGAGQDPGQPQETRGTGEREGEGAS